MRFRFQLVVIGCLLMMVGVVVATEPCDPRGSLGMRYYVPAPANQRVTVTLSAMDSDSMFVPLDSDSSYVLFDNVLPHPDTLLFLDQECYWDSESRALYPQPIVIPMPPLTSGFYLWTVQTEDSTYTKKMLVMM